MANQYSKLTRDNVMRKVNRKKSPVRSLAGLAREFGVNTSFYASGKGKIDHSVPSSFRERVRNLVGTTNLNRIRQREHINKGFEGSTGW